MIKIRRNPTAPIVELSLEEFEQGARNGEIAPQHLVCFPAVTGAQFVMARELELYRGLHVEGTITFQRYFHLARVPWVTTLLVGALVAVYYLWQGGEAATVQELAREGAKSPALMIELGQWWRLITANLLHVSGWHLLGNAVFLFNLGGPTEAIFRRLDYLLVVIASALGTTIVSTLANPAVSCGASGIVFGVWGAAAVFGARHRAILPQRYRRYFIGSVIPYSVFALYIGFAFEGIDQWGHFGGLVFGSAIALFLPARLLEPRDPLVPQKLAALGAISLALAGATLLAAGAGDLINYRYFPKHGLAMPVPQRWDQIVAHRDEQTETFAFENSAGVAIAIETGQRQRPIQDSDLIRSFVEQDLAQQLRLANVSGLRLSETQPAKLAGLDAQRVRADILVAGVPSRIDFVVAGRGYFRYVLSSSAPIWLREAYEPTFTKIIDAVVTTEPDELQTARSKDREGATPASRSELAKALAHAGDYQQALSILENAAQQWPKSGLIRATRAQLLFEHGEKLAEACDSMQEALQTVSWTPELLLLAYDMQLACGNEELAGRILDAASLRFPGTPEIERRRIHVRRLP